MIAYIGIGELLIWAIIFGLYLFWVWMMVDCATQMDNADPKKKSWVIWMCIQGTVGAGVYFSGPRSRRLKG
jgi:hypothetical protein